MKAWIQARNSRKSLAESWRGKPDAELARPLGKPKRSIARTDDARVIRFAHRLREGMALHLRQIAQNDRIARRLRRAGSGAAKRPSRDPALLWVRS